MTTSWATPIFTAVIGNLDIITGGDDWSVALVSHDGSPYDAKSTRILTLPLLWLVILTLYWACTQLWNVVLVQLSLAFFHLSRCVPSSIMRQPTAKLTLIGALSHILLLMLIALLGFVLGGLLVHDLNVLVVLITSWLLSSLWHWCVLSLSSYILILLTYRPTWLIHSICGTKRWWLVDEAHLVLDINWVHILVEVWRPLIIHCGS